MNIPLPPRISILGVKFNAISMMNAIQSIRHWIEEGRGEYICVANAHSVMECHRDLELLEAFNHSGMTTPDGMSIVWLMKLQGCRNVERVYGPDLMLRVCEHSIKEGWRHFFYGGAPGVADRLAEKMKSRFPGLEVVGTYTPPFRSLAVREDEAVIEMIRARQPHIIWIGISTPKQERWMAEHHKYFQEQVLIGVGAAFDFLSGMKKQAPRWVQRSGLEWLFRLVNEPRRLWRRYIQYPYFGVLVLMQLAGIRRYSDE